MISSTGIWLRLSSILHITCPSLQPLLESGKARSKACFRFNVQKQPVPEASGTSLAKKPCLDTRTESCSDDRSSSGGTSANSTKSRKKWSPG